MNAKTCPQNVCQRSYLSNRLYDRDFPAKIFVAGIFAVVHSTSNQTNARDAMPLVFQTRNDGDGCAKRAGFSLVELTVVVAISTILAALLLPALSTAKEKSRRAVCKSNLRTILYALEAYGDDSRGYLPNAADNAGYYHSIVLSDQTYNSLMAEAGWESNIFYCPNIQSNVGSHNQYGYTIGYSYLATGNITQSGTSPDYYVGPTTLTDGYGTNAIIADANYWTSDSSQPTLAPHTKSGAAATAAVAMVSNVSQARAQSPTAAGAMGGNIGYLNGAVIWKPISLMGNYHASSTPEAWGNW
jgi:prepilin-type N-terminal cleavage/methylation domain-containing protein